MSGMHCAECARMLTFHGLARPLCVLQDPRTQAVVGEVLTLLHTPPPSWAAQVKKDILVKQEEEMLHRWDWDDLNRRLSFYLYRRLSILLLILLDVSQVLLRSLRFGRRLGGLEVVRQWRHRRHRPLAVQVLL